MVVFLLILAIASFVLALVVELTFISPRRTFREESTLQKMERFFRLLERSIGLIPSEKESERLKYMNHYSYFDENLSRFQRLPSFYEPLLVKHDATFSVLVAFFSATYEYEDLRLLMSEEGVEKVDRLLGLFYEDVKNLEENEEASSTENNSILDDLDKQYDDLLNATKTNESVNRGCEPVTVDELINHTIAELEKINQKRKEKE